MLQLKPWKLEGGDHTLLDLMPFLEAVYRANPPDVRKVVEGYEGQDIPSAFRYKVYDVDMLTLLRVAGSKYCVSSTCCQLHIYDRAVLHDNDL